MGAVVLKGRELFPIAVILVSGVPPDSLGKAERDSRLWRQEPQREGLGGYERGQGSVLAGNNRGRPAVAHVLNVAIAHRHVGALPYRESRRERARVDVADVVRLVAKNVLAIREVLNAAQRIQVQSRPAGIDGEPIVGGPGSVR